MSRFGNKATLEIENFDNLEQNPLLASLKINGQPFVVNAGSVPELLRELATSIEVWEKHNQKKIHI